MERLYRGFMSRIFNFHQMSIGNPKQPTISIYSLVDDEYIVNQFRGDDLIISPLFPELKLTLSQILQNI